MTIREIISKEFDTRMEIAIMDYILDKGTEYICSITEDDINAIDGNGLMTKKFEQAFVKCARHICTEFSTIDILKYIANMSLEGALKTELEIYKDNCEECLWDDLMYKLEYQIDCISDLDYEEEPTMIVVDVTVKEAK